MMMERRDIACLHEPFAQLADFGESDVGGYAARSQDDVIDALRRLARRQRVFFKDTMDFRYPRVLADQEFLRDAGHALLIRNPREVIASHFALNPGLRCEDIGFTRLRELWDAIQTATRHRPVVLDADGLLDHPDATVRAYCSLMRLSFDPEAMHWAAGPRPEWRRTQRWHENASASEGFTRAEPSCYRHTVDNHPMLAECYRHQLPAYEYLYQRRLIA
jgi:hypothetical protein